MPNWCQNTLNIFHEDKGKVDKLQNVLNTEEPKMFEHLCPQPNDVDDWYSWNIENWGTKWDASIIDYERLDDNTISIVFDTAWSPPTKWYEYIEELGWGVDAHYLEESMGFVGRYFAGTDEEYEIDYCLSKEECLKGIAQECIDHWGLDEQWESINDEGENDEPIIH